MQAKKLTIVEFNGLASKPFDFKLVDDLGVSFWIIGGDFAKNHNLGRIFGKPEIDMFDMGWQIEALTTEIDELNIVTKILRYKEPGGEWEVKTW